MEWSAALDETKDGTTSLQGGALFDMVHPDDHAAAAGELNPRAAARLPSPPGRDTGRHRDAGGRSRRLALDRGADREGPHDLEVAAELKRTWARPDGVELIDAMDILAAPEDHRVRLLLPMEPATPAVLARRASQLGGRGAGDLEGEPTRARLGTMVRRAVEEKQYDKDRPRAREVLEQWLKVKDQYDPEANKEAIWLSDAVLVACAKWAKENNRSSGWASSSSVSGSPAMTGLPYYANQGRSADGHIIEDHPPGTPVIASIASNGEGRNLQAWSSNLFATWPSSGATCEQALGRTHRDGQEANEVTAEIIASIPEVLLDFDRSVSDARYIGDTTGQEQKLSYADIAIPPKEDRGGLWLLDQVP